MENLSAVRILIDGLILSVGLSIVLLGSLYYNPRLWLQDYPAEIRERVAPLTSGEKRSRAIVGVLFFGVAIAAIVYTLAQLRAANGGSVTFLTAFLHLFGVMSVFNIWDAVVLDLVMLAGLKPKFAMIPGTEGLEYVYTNWHWHFVNFLKGIGFCAVLSVPFALVASVL
jgi:hypothetical protein